MQLVESWFSRIYGAEDAMKRTWRRRWRKLIVLVAALACAGTWAASQVRSVRDKSEVAKMMEKMKPVCVGRLLIDVPADAELNVAEETIAGFNIETVEESEAAFRDRIAAREADIEAGGSRRGADGEGGMVQARELRVDNMVGRVFIYGHSRNYMMDGDRRIDLESVSVEAHAHTAGLSFSLSAKSTQEESANEAEALLARLQTRGEDEIPTVPGFCTSRAVFAEPLPPHKSENITMFVALPSHPDLGIALFSIANANPGPALLARASDVDAAASGDEMLRTTKLRSARREINGMVGEELAERIRELNFTTGYTLNWETRGVQGNLSLPYLSFEMQTGANARAGGKPVDSSLHEDAVLALWDSVSSTIRLRKTDPPPPTSVPEPDGPKLGTTARAGDVCPQSGWWECGAGEDGLRVHGGQVQYLHKGQRIPQALLLPQQTLWQKVRGIQPSIEPNHLTVWQLVDKRTRPRVPVTASLAPAGLGAAALDMRTASEGSVVIGSYVRTGDACPASGWWRCEESHALDGTRWFSAGSLLPAATFRVPSGVFGRAAGPEVIQRRSAWQLVRPADAPSIAQHPLSPEPAAVSNRPPIPYDPPTLG
jgi:hypothetical protein